MAKSSQMKKEGLFLLASHFISLLGIIQSFRYLGEQKEAEKSAFHLDPLFLRIDVWDWLSVQFPDLHVQIGCNANPDYIWDKKPASDGRHTKEQKDRYFDSTGLLR
jgi:hypothetical protein